MKLDERNIGLIVEKVVERLVSDGKRPHSTPARIDPTSASFRYRSSGNAGGMRQR